MSDTDKKAKAVKVFQGKARKPFEDRAKAIERHRKKRTPEGS